jgi:soluble lytic murein transglycosylase-like protein
MGLAQITPPTWVEWSKKIGVSNPYDPASNLRVGAAYLRWCLGQTGNDRVKALIAYNWGLGNLQSGVQAPLETRIYAYSVVHGADLLKAWEGIK